MKALVTYLSLTGNTKKVAETIFDELQCEKEIYPLSEISSLEGYDIIFAGFPVWQFEPAKPAADFLNANAKAKNIAIFVTHAMPYEMQTREDQNKLNIMLDKCRKCAAEGYLAGFFHCRGKLSESAASLFIKSMNPKLKQFGEKRRKTFKHPQKGELDVARIFTRDVINRVQAGGSGCRSDRQYTIPVFQPCSAAPKDIQRNILNQCQDSCDR